jgi:choline monooxygenase
VVTEPCGIASILHCPYHGWNYGLDGALKGMPEFDGVRNFDRHDNGLVPVKAETWEAFVFVNLDPQAEPLTDFLGGLVKRCEPLDSANSTSSIARFTTSPATGRFS